MVTPITKNQNLHLLEQAKGVIDHTHKYLYNLGHSILKKHYIYK